MIDLKIHSHGERGRTATVTINHAAKLNCMNQRVRRELVATFNDLSKDDELRAVVLTGAGEKAFIGGADVSELAALSPVTAAPFITEIHDCCEIVRKCPVPVIARIRGYVLGAGLELAASCDMRVASTDARFGMPEVKIGMPSVIEAALLPQLIGWGRTRYLLLTGETISVSDARDWGMFDFVVAPDQLDATVDNLVEAIVAAGPRAVRDQKALISDWERLPVELAIQRGIAAFAATWLGDEAPKMTNARLALMREN